MRRYLFALIAPVLLFASCEVVEGDEREPMDVGKYIARRTIYYNIQTLQEYFDYAVVADWYLSTEDEELKERIANRFMPYYQIVAEEGFVRFKFSYPWSDGTPRYYREYITDGKLLSEGGEWKIVASDEILAVIKATDGVYSFTSTSEDHENLFTIGSLECDINNGISYTVDGWLNGDNGDYGNWKEAKVLVSTEITTPLHYRSNSFNHNFFTEGSMDIICDDKRIDRRDEVTVTFKTYSTAEVEYLGQKEVWEY